MRWMLAQATLRKNHYVVTMRHSFCQAFGETYDPRDGLGPAIGKRKTRGRVQFIRASRFSAVGMARIIVHLKSLLLVAMTLQLGCQQRFPSGVRRTCGQPNVFLE